MAPPVVNTPFQDPDFGSRMVRVTDGSTRAAYAGGYFRGVSYGTDSSGEANEWSVFDPSIGTHGGYRFYVYDRSGNLIPFALDATTMTVERLTGQVGSHLNTFGALDLSSPTFSYNNPNEIFGTNGTQLVSYNFSNDTTSFIYDFASCPGLPPYVWGYAGGLTNSADDNKFTWYFGGQAQGDTDFVVYYDRTANNGAGACYWYDSITAMAGGTGMSPTPVAGEAGQLPAPGAPVVAAIPGGGNLRPGTYYVRITALTHTNPSDGETTPSAEVPVSLPFWGSIVVTFPSIQNVASLLLSGPANTPAFNVYIGTSSGAEQLQTSGGVSGAVYVQSAPLVSGAAPPTQNTAGYNVHNARMSTDGNMVRVNNQETTMFYFWTPGTNHVTVCPTDCTGHQAFGYSHMINDPDNRDMAEVVVRPLNNLSSVTELVNPLPNPQQFTDSHWSWNDSSSSDTMPVCGSFYMSNRAGDGTLSPTSNPLLAITAPYDREIDCVATSGPSRVWRFAHNRGTGASNASANSGSNFFAIPIGNVSQDGRFYMFSSDWDWQLGSDAGSWGCPYSGQCRTDVFIVELH